MLGVWSPGMSTGLFIYFWSLVYLSEVLRALHTQVYNATVGRGVAVMVIDQVLRRRETVK